MPRGPLVAGGSPAVHARIAAPEFSPSQGTVPLHAGQAAPAPDAAGQAAPAAATAAPEKIY